MKKELRDAWVKDLRENAPASMKGPQFGMNSENPCALARAIIIGGEVPEDHRTMTAFQDSESKFYLGISPSQIWARSDTGVPPKCLATFIEEAVVVT